ncbi:MAG: hypothetical protein GY862_25795 [Gammaproteobacteria bacterium]|nr:hypothetical protein [Gammaproteobacteria bacterium]
MRELLLPKVNDAEYRDAVETFFTTGDLQPLCERQSGSHAPHGNQLGGTETSASLH